MRNRLLTNLAAFISKKPWYSAGALLIVTILFGWLMGQLTMETNFTAMMPKGDPMVEEFDRIMEEFAGAASMIVVAEGDPEKLIEFADRAAIEIEKMTEYVKKVDYTLPKELIADHALMLMKTEDLETNRSLFTDPNLTGFLKNMNDSFEQEYTGSGGGSIEGQEQEQGAIRFMDGLQTYAEAVNQVLDGNNDNAGVIASDAILYGDTYYRSWDRQMLIMQIVPTFDMMDINADTTATNAAERIVREIAEELGVYAGLTGIIPLARDEMVAMETDSFTITSIALIGILILFIIAFRMVVSPILAITTLIIGIIWALGLSYLFVGSLNMMTAMMGVILVGLGIDFSIHIIAVYSEMRSLGKDVEESLKITMQKSGLGVLTGGFTTSAAFLTMIATSSRGYQEFGITLGTGILMTMFAALTVLPTLLVIRERTVAKFRKNAKIKPIKNISYQRLGAGSHWIARHPGASGIVAIILIAFLGYHGSIITWDYNYLNMEPEGLESIILQDKMIDKLDISGDYAYFTADNLKEAQRLTDAAKKMKTSGMVRSIVDFLPAEEEQADRQKIVREIQRDLKDAEIKQDFTQGDFDQFLTEMARLEMNIMEIQDMANIGNQDKVYLKTGLLVGVVPEDEDETIMGWQKTLAGVSPNINTGIFSELIRRLESNDKSALEKLKIFQQDFGKAYLSSAIRMANPEPITLETIPPTIRSQYVGESGDLFLITIFPKANVWDNIYLNQFTSELEDISPRATGMPPVYKRLIDIFAKDGKIATKLAIAVIFIILLLDFRKLKRAVLAIIPLVVGAIWMLGTMELTGMQLTMMNIMAVPLIIGIGIDDGVHLVHRYQIEGWGNHKAVFASTGRAIFLTSLTTMLGFGSLLFATYRGLGSMGGALFIGVGTCFLASVLVVPAVLGMINNYNNKKK
ncbi:MAG: MMPL family transporter [Candidatus Marinimicrobia bacterium]|nr:MMPL family transporter [Candidatus Neomarinimicrobiota bacterium]